MLEAQHEKENLRRSCVCDAPKKSAQKAECYAKKIGRAPLGSIQNVTGFNQYLSVPGQNVKLQRSKSTSETDRNGSSATTGYRRKLLNNFSPASVRGQNKGTIQVSQAHVTRPPIKESLKCALRTIRSTSVTTYTDQNYLAQSQTQPPQHALQKASSQGYTANIVPAQTNEEAKQMLNKNISKYFAEEKSQPGGVFEERRYYEKSRQIEHLKTSSTSLVRSTNTQVSHILAGNKISESSSENKSQSHLNKNICGGNGKHNLAHNGIQSTINTKRSEIQVVSGNKISEFHSENQFQSQLQSVSQNFCREQSSFPLSDQNSSLNRKQYNTTSTNTSGSNETLSLSKKQFIDYILKENNIERNNSTQNSTNVTEVRNQQVRGSNNATDYSNYVTDHSTISTTLACDINDTKKYYQIEDRNVAHIRGPLVPVADWPFVDGRKFFLEEPDIATQTTTISPSVFNFPARKNSISERNSACVRRPGVKSTLKKNGSIRQSDKTLLYAWEYVEDIIGYLKTIERNLLVCPIAVEQLVHKSSRSAYVNWLMQLSEVRTPNNNPVFFMALRIFDWSIINLKKRESSYRLAAAISYWIATKYLTNAEIKVPKIYSSCNGKYSKIEILTMEALILKKLDFNLTMADPLDFLNYYLKKLNFDKDRNLEYSTQFIIDCSALYENYMVTEPSFLAATALCLAYRVLCQTSEIFHKFVEYQPWTLENYADKVLIVNIRYTFLKKFAPISKYATPDKLNVIQYFVDM